MPRVPLMVGALLAILWSTWPVTVSAAPQPLVQVGPASNPWAGHSDRLGGVDANQNVEVEVALNLRDQAGLKDLIARTSTPGSPDYGHYLTAKQVEDRFGPTQENVQRVADHLRSQGLTVTNASAGNFLVDATGSAAQVMQATHTSLSRYRDRKTGRDFFANDSPPTLPADVAAVVQGVIGLDNHALRRPSAPPCQGCANAPYTMTQVRAGYNFNAAPISALTGAGQSMGLLELNTFSQANVTQFDATYGLATGTPTVYTVPDGFGNSVSSTFGGEVEVELDIEVMQGIAPGASIMVFEAPNTNAGVNHGYDCMWRTSPSYCPNVVTPTANSTSWGLCENDQGQTETNLLDSIFSQAAASGHSFYAASGDLGTNDGCSQTPAADSPASDPYVTGAGGTKLFLNGADNSWNNETAWPAEPKNTLGAGGGLSKFFSRPTWQNGPGVLNSFSNGFRQVPDIAANADPVTGFSIYTCSSTPNQQTCAPGFFSIGGTSAAAPAWAAFTAIYNQYATSQAKPTLGFANPTLYAAQTCPLGHQPFHDITQGSNPNNIPFAVSLGWDFLTGIGSLNAAELAQTLAALGTVGVTLTSVDQVRGTGGEFVQLFGCGFQQTPTVTFGGVLSPDVQFVGSNALLVKTPQHAAGTVSVSVSNPNNTSSTLSNAFHYNRGASHQQLVTNRDGRLELSVTATDGGIYHSWEATPSGSFGPLYPLGHPGAGAFVSDPASGLNQDGRVEDFGVDGSGNVWHAWMVAPGSGWTQFYSLGTPAGGPVQGNLAVATNPDGRLEIFARAADGAVWHAWQVSPNGVWGGWWSLGKFGSSGFVSDVTAGHNGDGRLEIAAVDANGLVWHAWQTSPGRGWTSQFYPLPGRAVAGNPGINTNLDGRLEIFATAADNRSAVHVWQNEPSGGWGNWWSVGGALGSDPSVSRNADGRLEVFANDMTGNLIHVWQGWAGGSWVGPFSLGQAPTGPLVGVPQTGTYADGRVQAIIPDVSSGQEWQILQTSPGGGWTGLSTLGGSVQVLAY